MVTCRLTRPITSALADWQRFSPSKSPSAFSLGQSSRCSRPDAEVISALALVRTRARVTREPQQSRSQFITGSARAEWAPVQHHQCERAHTRVFERWAAHSGAVESPSTRRSGCARGTSHMTVVIQQRATALQWLVTAVQFTVSHIDSKYQ